MSARAVSWAKLQKAPTVTAKAILVCLADYTDADGCAWPAIRTLAAEVQVSERTAQRAIRSLEEVGLLIRGERARSDGGQTSNAYRLAMEKTPPSICHPPGDTSVTPPVSAVSPPNERPLEREVSDETSPAPKKALRPVFERAWKAFPEPGRKRSSVKQSEPEWKSASKAAGGEERLCQAVERFAECEEARRDGGKFVQGFHRWLRDGRWEHWLDDDPSPSTVVDLDPWPRRLREWERNRYWPDDWGPKPGRPGYQGPPIPDRAA